MELTVQPAAEWRQIFQDAWRMERDFFYDPGLHGVDWAKMRERYARLIDQCSTRGDVNYVLGELIGELNASHTYRSGGDLDPSPGRSVGYLGCDYALEQGAWRIKRIPEVAAWEYTIRSPLRAPASGRRRRLAPRREWPPAGSKKPAAAFQASRQNPSC
jgi:tricorn protease